MMGTGEPILKDNKRGVRIPADRRLPKTYNAYHIKETVEQQTERRLAEKRLANLMGLK